MTSKVKGMTKQDQIKMKKVTNEQSKRIQEKANENEINTVIQKLKSNQKLINPLALLQVCLEIVNGRLANLKNSKVEQFYIAQNGGGWRNEPKISKLDANKKTYELIVKALKLQLPEEYVIKHTMKQASETPTIDRIVLEMYNTLKSVKISNQVETVNSNVDVLDNDHHINDGSKSSTENLITDKPE
jgi:hypothetical protein